jgi:hypothetical protein
MTPFSMESVFLILSGVIFMAGILYWFWSHIQLTQKKVLLLESAVFELRSQMTRLPEPPSYKPAYTELADDWEEDASGTAVPSPPSGPSESMEVDDSNIPDDLRPGGRMSVEENIMQPNSVQEQQTPEESNTQFRELFVNENSNKVVSELPPKTPESLESMSLKELRRLAEQRGIPNTNDLRKKEILSALRQQISPPTEELKVVQLQENEAEILE